MLLMLLSETSCYTMEFSVPPEENTQKNIFFRLSQRGIEKYAEANVQRAVGYIIGQSLGDIQFSVVGFDFQLNNIVLQSMAVPKARVAFIDDINSGRISLTDASLQFAFEFKLSKNVFPYIQDVGTGKIKMKLNQLGFIAASPFNEECPGQLLMNISEGMCDIDYLTTQFDSDLAFLLNAIMPILNNFLVELFNTEIGGGFVQILADQIFAQMASFNPISYIDYYRVFMQDQRWIGGVDINDREMVIAASGLSCLNVSQDRNICNRTQTFPALPRAPYAMNYDITYEISRNAFESAFSFVWELNSTYIRENLKIEEVRFYVPRIVGMGVVTELEYVREGVQHRIQFLGKLRLARSIWQYDNVEVVWARPGLDTVTAAASEDPQVAENLRVAFDKLLDDFAFTAENAFNIDIEHAAVVYASPDWVFLGCSVVLS